MVTFIKGDVSEDVVLQPQRALLAKINCVRGGGVITPMLNDAEYEDNTLDQLFIELKSIYLDIQMEASNCKYQAKIV